MIGQDELAELPESVQRYLRFMGIVGRPRDWSFMARLEGRFRLGPNDSWRSMRALQYSTRASRTRIFHLELSVFGVPVLGRDTYLSGNGRMEIRPLDLFTFQDDTGPELDSGELVTYLNDAVLLSPSFLLTRGVKFEALNGAGFGVSLEDRGRVVSARVSLDDRGAPIDFVTEDRFVQDPYAREHPFVRCRWSTPITGWQEASGRRLPRSGSAVWHLPQGDFTYVELDFRPERLVFNVPPILR